MINKNNLKNFFFIHCILISICVFIITLILFNHIYKNNINNIKKNLDACAEILKPNLIKMINNTNFKEIYDIKNSKITIINPDGEFLASNFDTSKTNKKNDYDIIQSKVLLKGDNVETFNATTSTINFTISLYTDKKLIGFARLTEYTDNVYGLISKTKKFILLEILLIFLLNFIFYKLLFSYFVAPLKSLSFTLERVKNGDLSTKLFIHPNEKFHELFDEFNNALDYIYHTFTILTTRKQEFESIVNNIDAEFFIINKEGKIILANNKFRAANPIILDDKNKYWQIIKNREIKLLIDKCQIEQKTLIQEIELPDKIILANTTFIPNENEIVGIFYDITQIKNLEQIKKDFISNVSHELRTPLTAIKGFAETLRDSATSEQLQYLNIIERNAERLIALVNDLLTLSELEKNKFKLEKKPFDIINLMNNVITIFQPTASKKQLALIPDFQASKIIITADESKIEQLLINLIDNAIKYTDKGMIKISVSSDDKKIAIQIQDTGLGIPNEHINRIFERFYVVDKSRSKKSGGTGLGLAIVKHITVLHDGKITVKSLPNQGTTFSIELPII